MTNDSIASDKNTDSSKPPSRKRGKGFPVVPLSEAAQILKEAGKYGFEHSTASFAVHMGHKSTTSGAFRQRLAAFRDWGLITGRGGMLTMTEVARKIAMPTDDDAERQALQQAFWNCDVFTGLHEGMAKGQPLDRDRVGSQAVHGFDVAPHRAQQFARSFVDSAVAAQLAKIDGQGSLVLLEPGNDAQPEDGDPPDQRPIIAEAEESQPTQTGRPVDRQPSGALSPTIRQSWSISGGEIILEVRSGEALPATVFGAIGEVVTKLEALAASLSQPEDLDAADDGGEP